MDELLPYLYHGADSYPHCESKYYAVHDGRAASFDRPPGIQRCRHCALIQTEYTYWTAPEGPPSINNGTDCHESMVKSLPHLVPLLAAHDAVLVACYSPHPLVDALRAEITKQNDRFPKPVIGILEASVTAALNVLEPKETFGVVSTGKVWEHLIGARIGEMLGATPTPASDANDSAPFRTPVFAGVETTGLNATELHDAHQDLVKRKVQEATQRLVQGEQKVRTIVLGCAGMAAMEEWIREVVDARTYVIDGVRAGVAALQSTLRCAQ